MPLPGSFLLSPTSWDSGPCQYLFRDKLTLVKQISLTPQPPGTSVLANSYLFEDNLALINKFPSLPNLLKYESPSVPLRRQIDVSKTLPFSPTSWDLGFRQYLFEDTDLSLIKPVSLRLSPTSWDFGSRQHLIQDKLTLVKQVSVCPQPPGMWILASTS